MMDLDFLQLTPKGNIGGVEIAATLREIYTDTVQSTMHPVELGAPITDHAFRRPSEVVLQCGWSNSGLESFFAAAAAFFESGELSGMDYVGGVYSKLLALQESRIPFTITTSKRQYRNMLIAALQVTTDEKTSNILMCQATCREILIVTTQSTAMPDKANQAAPESTASVENTGTKQAVPAIPSPGGSAPIGN